MRIVKMEIRFCKCLCGDSFECLPRSPKKYIIGHDKIGKKISQEVKEKIKDSNVGKHYGKKNGMFGVIGDKHPCWKGEKVKKKRIKLLGNHSKLEWLKLKEECGYRCSICNKTEKELINIYPNLRYQQLTKDHIIPVSKGGTDYIENIQPLCHSCNASKKDKDIDIVYCCGVFDLFHVGHLKLLERAKQYGSYLIVGVVKDNAVKKQKGDSRPIVNELSRLNIVRCFRVVNKVLLQDSFDPTQNIQYLISKGLKINVFIWGEDQAHVNVENVEKLGLKKIILKRTIGISTGDIIKKIKETCY